MMKDFIQYVLPWIIVVLIAVLTMVRYAKK